MVNGTQPWGTSATNVQCIALSCAFVGAIRRRYWRSQYSEARANRPYLFACLPLRVLFRLPFFSTLASRRFAPCARTAYNHIVVRGPSVWNDGLFLDQRLIALTTKRRR